MDLVCTQTPFSEPVSSAELLQHMRIDDPIENDIYLRALISSVRAMAESVCRRALMEQEWTLYLDSFPAGKITLPLPPLVSVNSITYKVDGVDVELSEDEYVVSIGREPATIEPVKIWPTVKPKAGCVAIAFTAGYESASAVPAGIRQWIMMQAAAMYENRESEFSVQGSVSKVSMNTLADALLRPHRVVAL